MVHRLVRGNRLSRAKSITARSVVEFKVVKEKPLIAYCLIQGSASQPYMVFIDLKKNLVGHKCPDYMKGQGWCKHIGKLLFLLEESQVDEIYKSRSKLREIKRDNEIREHMDKYKADSIQETVATGDIPLPNQIEILGNMIAKNQRVAQILPNIKTAIKTELEKTHIDQIPYRVSFLLSSVPKFSLDSVIKQTRDSFEPFLAKSVDYFFKSLWVMNTVKQLEQAHLIQYIFKKFNRALSIPSLKFPSSVTEEEKRDLSIVLKLLLQNHPNIYQKFIKDNKMVFPAEVLMSRAKRMVTSLKIATSPVKEVEDWLKTQISIVFHQGTSHRSHQDFLIYLMKSSGEKVTYQIKKGGSSRGYSRRYSRGGFTSFPITLLEINPCLKYIIENIKESEREYLTDRDIEYNNKFFQWLAGKPVDTKWIEKPRTRAIDSALGTNGIIIQLDVNYTKLYSEFFHAFDGSQRLVVDPSSPLMSAIQPFDYVYCIPQMKERRDRARIVYPQHILLPDQVVSLILKGVPIVSTLLPWSVLSAFFKQGYLSGAEVSAAIAKSSQFKFIYGSIDLVKALEDLVMIGKAGLTEEGFLDFQKKITIQSRTMTTRVREIAREFIQNEGRALVTLIETVDLEEKESLKAVVGAIRRNNTVEGFRLQVVNELVKAYLTANIPEKDFFKNLEKLEKSPYRHAPKLVAELYISYYKKLETKLLTPTPTRKQAYSNPIGRMMMDDLGYAKIGNLTNIEKFTLYQSLVRVRPSFIFDKTADTKKTTTKSRKVRIEDLILKTQSGKSKEQIVALTELSLHDSKKVTEHLTSLLESKDEKTRNMAFIALLYRGQKDLLKIVNKKLSHESVKIRLSSLNNLTKISSPKVLECVTEATKNDEPKVRKQALEHLINYKQFILGSQETTAKANLLSCLKERFDDEEDSLKAFAIDELSKLPFQETGDLLKESFDNKNDYIRKKATQTLISKGDFDAQQEILVKMSNDTNYENRLYALETLASKNMPEGRKVLIKSITDKDEGIRNSIVALLSQGRNVHRENYSKVILKQLLNHYKENNLPMPIDSARNLAHAEETILPLIVPFFDDVNYTDKVGMLNIITSMVKPERYLEVVKLIEHSEAELRAAALLHLGSNNHNKTKEFTKKLLADKEGVVRLAAVKMIEKKNYDIKDYSLPLLRKFIQTHVENQRPFSPSSRTKLVNLQKKVVNPLIKIFESKAIPTQLTTLRVISEIKTPEASEFIISSIDNPEPLIRSLALELIIKVDHPKARVHVDKALDDKDEQVRLKAVNYLINTKIPTSNYTDKLIKNIINLSLYTQKKRTPTEIDEKVIELKDRAIPFLLKELKDKNRERVLYFARLISKIDSDKAQPEMVKYLDGEDVELKKIALEYLTKTKYENIAESMIQSLKTSSDLNYKLKVFNLLIPNASKEQYSKETIRFLIHEFLKLSDTTCSRTMGLLKVLGKSITPELIEGLRSENKNVQRFSAEILGDIKDKKATNELVKILTSKEDLVRRSAVYALRSIQDEKSIPALIKALSDKDTYVRRSAIKGLGLMKAKEAETVLNKMRKGADNLTQGMIDDALKEMK
ncbi:MAG: hypothetical protein GPJ51_05550 [Candidatus Heimdallarchaeota archaeon]|nr:hypothetical protein [Candidatus Heimdallarchaeota archaeon]